MKKYLLYLILVLFISATVGCATEEEKAQKVATEFLQEFYTATPAIYEEKINLTTLYHESKTYPEIKVKIKKYLDDKFGDTLSGKYLSGEILGRSEYQYPPKAARDQNANLSVDEVTLKKIESKIEDKFYNFDVLVKINYVEEDKEDEYETILGQIRITFEDNKYKVYGVRYFSGDLWKYIDNSY